jgi:hypothetical protein
MPLQIESLSPARVVTGVEGVRASGLRLARA